MIHRQALEAAHLRIAHLEGEVAEQQATITRLKKPVVVEPPQSPKSAADSAPPVATRDDEPSWLRWLALWPAVLLAVIAGIYVAKFGASLPRMDPRELLPLGRGSFASGAAGAALMTMVYVFRGRAGGTSSVAQRILIVLSCVCFAPFVVGLLAYGLAVATLVLGIASLLWACVAAGVAVVRWIADSTPD